MKLETEEEAIRQQEENELLLALVSLEIEYKQQQREDFLKSIHPDFTEEFRKNEKRRDLVIKNVKSELVRG